MLWLLGPIWVCGDWWSFVSCPLQVFEPIFGDRLIQTKPKVCWDFLSGRWQVAPEMAQGSSEATKAPPTSLTTCHCEVCDKTCNRNPARPDHRFSFLQWSLCCSPCNVCMYACMYCFFRNLQQLILDSTWFMVMILWPRLTQLCQAHSADRESLLSQALAQSQAAAKNRKGTDETNVRDELLQMEEKEHSAFINILKDYCKKCWPYKPCSSIFPLRLHVKSNQAKKGRD